MSACYELVEKYGRGAVYLGSSRVDETHPLTASTHRGFDHEREADAFSLREQARVSLIFSVISRDHRDPSLGDGEAREAGGTGTTSAAMAPGIRRRSSRGDSQSGANALPALEALQN